MNDNVPPSINTLLDALDYPHNPDAWPYNWVPRIRDERMPFSDRSYDWKNWFQQKYPLDLVIPGPDSTPMNVIEPKSSLPAISWQTTHTT